MNCFALPLACCRNGFFEGHGQAINVGYIIAVDRPGFGFLLRAARFAVRGNADALAIREELLFDARQVFPAHLLDQAGQIEPDQPAAPQLGDELLAGEIEGVELQPGAEVGADDLRESEDRRATLSPHPGGVGAEGGESLQGGVVEKDLGQRRRLSLPPTLEQPLAHRDQGASNGERGEQPGPEKAADDHRDRWLRSDRVESGSSSASARRHLFDF